MQTEDFYQQAKNGKVSYGEALAEVIDCSKDVIRSEINLFTTEFKSFLPAFTKNASQAIIFGYLLAISIIPFLAFLIIGLGEILEGRYWLSSLIVSIVCAAIGAPLYFRAFNKIKTEDFKFTQTRSSLSEALSVTKEHVKAVKSASEGDRYEPKQSTIH